MSVSPTSQTISTKTTAQKSKGRRGWRWWAGRILLGLLALLILLVTVALAAAAGARARLQAQYPPTGQRVDIGGYRLHLDCQGQGSPTVVMDTGNGGLGLAWNLVQPEVAQTTQACVYDRAGYGWSDPSPKPRTPDVAAEELHTLLTEAGVAGPYLLVGHSYGGLIVRQFSSAYPDEVAGMVLVDSAHEEQYLRFPEPIRDSLSTMMLPFRLMKLVSASGIMALKPDILPVEGDPPQPTVAAIQAVIAANPSHMGTLVAEVENFYGQWERPPLPLGDIPLIVLSHGHLDPAALPPNTAPEVGEQYEQTWQAMQIELAALSSNGKRIVAEQSGHNIQFEQPDLVVAAIQEVLATARTGSKQ